MLFRVFRVFKCFVCLRLMTVVSKIQTRDKVSSAGLGHDEQLSTFLNKSLAINNRALRLLDFLSTAAFGPCILSEVFPFNIVNCVKPVHCSDRLRPPINVAIIVNATLKQNIQCRICPPDNVNIIEWYRE